MTNSHQTYKDTIFLPKTSFSMRGNLAQKEPKLVASWKQKNLYQHIRNHRLDHKPYILHWGPPYANGHLHAGHALNGILKDIVTRSRTLLGYNAPLVPGWDCHGLPIEWKIEEQYRKKGIKKEDVPIVKFRQDCREFAQKWVTVQSKEFERLGIACDTDHPYITMDFASESSIAGEFFKFLESGLVYKGVRPIMWSPIEKTALADAEMEYQDKKSPAIFVAFSIKENQTVIPDQAKFVIWTTTPWTIPGNRAISYGPDIDYVVVSADTVTEDSEVQAGEIFVLAKDLYGNLCEIFGISEPTLVKTIKGSELAGMICHHPLQSMGYDFDVPLIPGHHVTTETGTGLVHTAPGHGPDDFELGKKHNLEIADTINDNGVYCDFVHGFAGTHVYKADPLVIEALKASNALVHQSTIKHSYPHSWRSKAPLIFRTTPQWFIHMDKHDDKQSSKQVTTKAKTLREKALAAIESTTWLPSQGKNRIQGMVQDRPDWCLSRQRSWGVPIPLYTHRETGEILIDKCVNKRILAAFEKNGCDIWFEDNHQQFLAPDYDAKDYVPCKDILDVWFESGATQGFVLEDRPELQRPADLYLEGSDQHRGWFQSSLLVGCGTRDEAPFRSVVTHGFTVDAKGYKMSKSTGNTISPIDIAEDMGVEILRLWVVSCDYSDDLRISKDILKYQQDIYRRYRNTLRYLLGALADSKPTSLADTQDLPPLERYVLHKLDELYKDFIKSTESVDYQGFYSRLHHFCSVDLSAFYFDVRKDSLYCDSVNSRNRNATIAVMHQIFTYLVQFLAPVLPFTAEEAWQTYSQNLSNQNRSDQNQDNTSKNLEDFFISDSLHLSKLAPPHDTWEDQDLLEQFQTIRELRSSIMGELEKVRKDGLIGSSLQAHVIAYDPASLLRSMDLSAQDLEDLTIVSKVIIKNEAPAAELPHWNDVSFHIEKAVDEKCERCWKILPEVGQSSNHPTLCNRCESVVESLKNQQNDDYESLQKESVESKTLDNIFTDSV